MAITNTSQLLGKGARRSSTHDYCCLSAVTQRPGYSVTNDTELSIFNGEIEFEGKAHELNAFVDFAQLGTLVQPGKRYIVGAVPSYVLPYSQNSAVNAGVGYTAYDDSNRNTYVKPFINPAIVAAVNSFGGCAALSKKIFDGCATQAEISAFNDYHSEKSKQKCNLGSPEVDGVDLVLIEIQNQIKGSKCNALAGMTQCEFENLKARVGEIPVETWITTPAAISSQWQPPTSRFLFQSVDTYPTLADYQAGINGTSWAPFYNMAAADANGDEVAVVKLFSYPSTLADGQKGDAPKILNMLTYADSSYLGRVNPIYLGNDAPNPAVCTNASRLTKWCDPLPLMEITFAGSPAIINVEKEIYESYV